MPSLNNMTRPALNNHARSVGIAEPDIYPNISTLIGAIEELTTTGRPGRIQEDIERGKKARGEPAASDEPTVPAQPDPPGGGKPVHLFRPNMRVRVENMGTGTLRRFDREGLWQVEMDNESTIIARPDQLEPA